MELQYCQSLYAGWYRETPTLNETLQCKMQLLDSRESGMIPRQSVLFYFCFFYLLFILFIRVSLINIVDAMAGVHVNTGRKSRILVSSPNNYEIV
jgi:hypothetical protein